MKKHYETHVEDTDKLISVAGPVLDYKSWYEQYRKLMEEQAQRKYGLYTPTSEGDDDDFPSIPGITARYSALGLTNEQMAANPVWVDKTGNGHDLQMKNFSWKGMSGVGGYVGDFSKWVNNRDTTQDNPEYTSNEMHLHLASADLGQITIEQLPLYPGALVFDGVDDYGVCDNFPILTKEKGYTVVALRQWITRGEIAQGLVSNVKNWLKDGAFLLEYRNIQADHLNKPISFGAIGSENDLPHILTYQTSKSYNGVSITTGNFEGTDVLHVGKLAPTNVGTCINAAIWELVFLDHDATEEELTKIKDYFVKTYPWLFPGQAWTVVGKTNEDEDRATIANITGNGNDLVLSNVAFSENSGYGSYPFGMNVWNPDYIADQPYGTVHYPNDSKSYATTVKNNATNFRIKFRLRGLPEGGSFLIRVFDMNDLNTVLKTYTYTENGIHEFVYNDPNKPARIILYNGNTISNISEFYLDIIPEYEGYLVTDGVDDKVKSSIFTMNEDWTIVGDWELLSNVQINCGIVKAQNVYLYNTANGLLISINNPHSLQSFGTKSLHAICSDGRLYDRNWVEYEYTADQNFAIVESSLNIGFNLNNYTQMAFKNLGIYNNQLLSKDDCIKAYNYLQTLKSK